MEELSIARKQMISIMKRISEGDAKPDEVFSGLTIIQTNAMIGALEAAQRQAAALERIADALLAIDESLQLK